MLACYAPPKGDLSVGKPFEVQIGGQESHSYRLPFAAGTFVCLRIEQPGIDVKAKLVAPNGEVVQVFDDPSLRQDPDRLVRVMKTAGDYKLLVQPRNAKARGRYRVLLVELRAARAMDTDRVAAERSYEEGRRRLWVGGGGYIGSSAVPFDEALRLWAKAGDRWGEMDALIQIAELHSANGTAVKGLPLSQRAVRLARELGYQEGEARALQAQGNAQDHLSQSAAAIESFGKSVALFRSLHDEAREGLALYAMGNALATQRQLERAIQSQNRAYPLLAAAGDVNLAAKAMVAVAIIRLDRGETSQALEICEKARALAKRSGEDSAEASALSCLGDGHRQRGDLEVARRLFLESLALNRSRKALQNEAYVLQALGSVYFNLGDSPTALAEYGLALEITRKIHREDLQARLLTNSGWIYLVGGEPQKALELFQQALPIHQKANSKSGIALTLHNRGVAYTVLRRPQQGVADLRQALAMRRQIGARAAQANTLLEIGTAYRALARLKQADSSFNDAFALAHQLGNAPVEAECLFRRAALAADEGKLEAALGWMKSSLDIVESLRTSVLSDKLRAVFFASKRAYYDFYVDLLMRLEARYPRRYQAAALEASERARARALLDLLSEGHIDLMAGIAPGLKKRELDLEARLSFLQEKLGRLAVKDPEIAAVERQLGEAQIAMEELEAEVRSHHRRYADVRYPTPLRLAEMQRQLDGQTALIQYFIGRRGSFLFVVTRNGLASYRLPPLAAVSKDVALMRRLLQRPGRRHLRQYQDAAYRLYDSLLGPAAQILGRERRLLISPDGPLYFLPFEALLTEPGAAGTPSFGNLPYLLRRFAISYVPSATILRGLGEPREPRPATKRFVAFADPVYGQPGGTVASGPTTRGLAAARPLQRLVESRQEVERIASLFPLKTVELYLGRRATEENVKVNRWLATAEHVHFATHGTLDEAHPQLSGLELTRSATQDGTLSVYEIFDLRLSADLLTLSACDTALGQEVSGEGMMGMTRAFLYAGARSLVVSLWSVSERSTPQLMVDFYRHLSDSDEKTEALRRAKLTMIKSADHAAPYHWAPFILWGSPR